MKRPCGRIAKGPWSGLFPSLLALLAVGATPSAAAVRPSQASAGAAPTEALRAAPEGRWLEFRVSARARSRTWRSGSLRLTIDAGRETVDGVPMILTIRAPGMKPHRLEGFEEQPGRMRRLAVLRLSRGAKLPAVVLLSYSGGAHCCTQVLVAVPTGKGYRTIELADRADGDTIDYPRDLSGDGVPDFVLPDMRFLYAFTAYAFSLPPPIVRNLVDGKVVDVSAHPAFRPLYRSAMKQAERACRSADSATSAGGCPAYVAAAARLGRLDQAWLTMLAVHRPDPKWELPEHCFLEPRPGCTGRYGSYAEALAALLRARGYAPRGWVPPRLR